MRLGELVQALGPGLTGVIAAPRGVDAVVTDVVVHDPMDRSPGEPGQVVLGVGLDAHSAEALMPSLAAAGAAALMIKAEEPFSQSLARRASEAGVAVLAIPPGTSWSQLAILIHGLLSTSAFGTQDEGAGDAALGDLFAAANAVAQTVDAPIMIEDGQFRMLAFSERQDLVDEARSAAILGQRTPQKYLDVLRRGGFVEKLRRADEPVVIIGAAPHPRLAMSIRAGNEILGVVWAAFKNSPGDKEIQALAGCRDFLALHLLRHRLAVQSGEGLQAELVSTALQGGLLADDAARRLGLAGPAFRVVAVVEPEHEPIATQVRLARVRLLVALRASRAGASAAAAVLGKVLYAVVSVSARPERSLDAAKAFAREITDRPGFSGMHPMLVGIGGQVGNLEEIPSSRQDADQVLRLLRDQPARGPVAAIEELESVAMVQRLRDVASTQPGRRPEILKRIAEYDRRHGTPYLETLRAYLLAFGDREVAGRALGVHKNTVRYRMQQLRNTFEVALDDPDQRLALLLSLTLDGQVDPTDNHRRTAEPGDNLSERTRT